jgi:large subunit ribosomal protein L1
MPKKNTKTTTSENPVDVELDAQKDAESMTAHHSEPSIDEVASNPDEEAEKALSVEEGADTDSATPAELAALHTDNESAKAVNEKTDKKPAKAAPKKAKVRSKGYHAAKAHIEAGKLYPLEEAMELVKKVSLSKFDGSVEVHLKLTKKKNKGASESPKGIFHLPHGSGKQKNIIILDEAKIEEIAKTKKIDFDVAIATPDLMPKIGKIAKILGPKGKMPDPKSGTVTTDPQKAIDDINSGKVEYRIDAQNQIHQMIGKVSWDSSKLLENVRIVLAAFPKSRLETVHLSASISPSVVVDINSL